MTNKERVHAALEGRPVDRMPVTVLYNQLYHLDHYAELTGRPAWEWQRWQHADPEEHLAIYRTIVERAPFEILQPQGAPAREARKSVEFRKLQGRAERRAGPDAAWEPVVVESVSGHAYDDRPHQTRHVFTPADVRQRVKVTSAEDRIGSGANDFLDAAVGAFGRDHFILSGGVVGTLYSCSWHVGLTNLFAMLIQEPELIEYLSQRILEQNIEHIRQLAAAGGDAIYIDDATATSDMISVAHYERFCLPYLREMVGEIHSLGHKAILIYFGGVSDRLEQIASLGADGLSVEASMKGYTNDIGEIAARIGHRVTLFGNIDPVGVLQQGSDEQLEVEIRRQVAAGRRARGFIVCTGSPITPSTPLARVRRFIEMAIAIGASDRSAGSCDASASPVSGRGTGVPPVSQADGKRLNR